jgi:Leucine-rich repeat (LRR) protein
MNISERSQMTMRIRERDIKIRLAGTGTATINWGDGSETVTHNLMPYDEKEKDDAYTLCFKYSDWSVRTITISGENITYLDCSRNLVVKLDVSQNIALAVLICSNNRITALDVSNNTALTKLDCGDTLLTELDVSRNTALKSLDCKMRILSGAPEFV